jgi:hypothetical protein
MKVHWVLAVTRVLGVLVAIAAVAGSSVAAQEVGPKRGSLLIVGGGGRLGEVGTRAPITSWRRSSTAAASSADRQPAQRFRDRSWSAATQRATR